MGTGFGVADPEPPQFESGRAPIDPRERSHREQGVTRHAEAAEEHRRSRYRHSLRQGHRARQGQIRPCDHGLCPDRGQRRGGPSGRHRRADAGRAVPQQAGRDVCQRQERHLPLRAARRHDGRQAAPGRAPGCGQVHPVRRRGRRTRRAEAREGRREQSRFRSQVPADRREEDGRRGSGAAAARPRAAAGVDRRRRLRARQRLGTRRRRQSGYPGAWPHGGARRCRCHEDEHQHHERQHLVLRA